MPDVTPRSEYTEMLPMVVAIRDAVAGSYAVKSKNFLYLPHPSEVDKDSLEALQRYREYKARAEFDEYPGMSLTADLGKMHIDASTIVLPSGIEYLVNDCDGDGLDMVQQMERVASELMQVKFTLLAAEYQGLQGVNVESLSKAEADQLSPRATIKMYTRESVIDWQFSRVNGVMQLVYVALKQDGYKFDPAKRERVQVKSSLILALDADGNYYQQKIVDGDEGEREYPTVSGSPLKWLPVHIACDQPVTAELPKSLGYLSPICDLAYARYQVSADYKEAMRLLPPTTYTKGWRAGDLDTFKETNGGRDRIQTGAGAVNNLPENVTVDLVGADVELQGYERYFADNERKARALGATFPNDNEVAQTATEAGINEATRTARMQVIAGAIEAAYRRMCLYCGMFEGLWAPDAIENNLDAITIDLPRDFASQKLAPDEVNTILSLVMSGLMTKPQAIRALVRGGWHQGDAETVLAEIENAPPDELPAVPAKQEAVPND